jgi:hypothetical protein
VIQEEVEYSTWGGIIFLILSALVVAIEKQSNRVSAIGACLAYVIGLNLNIS